MQLSHAIPTTGHFGKEKTLAQILAQFFWPGFCREVADFCASCPECHLTTPQPAEKAPLIPFPLMSVPFERIGADSHPSGEGILVMLDYVTRFPEAVPVCSMNARKVAMELMNIFFRVGVLQEILTNPRQSSNCAGF